MTRIIVRTASVQLPTMPTRRGEVRYVALGDCYSVGEGSATDQSWPGMLASHLRLSNIPTHLVANAATMGCTTQDILNHQMAIYRAAQPTFATVLVGVNDYIQGVPVATFRNRFGKILDQMVSILPARHRMIVVTIPDFTVTPIGIRYAYRPDLPEGIAVFNFIIAREAQRRGIPCIDIYPVSQEMRGNPHFMASDQWHPSLGEYGRWEQVIFPVAYAVLKPVHGRVRITAGDH